MSNKPSTTAPDIVKDARQLYFAFRKCASKPSKIDNLDKLWEVLNDIREDGGRDYSIAEVGRRLEKVKGPKTQSIRNAQGTEYREIIGAFAKAVSGATRYVAKTKSSVEQALALITDPSVRATIRVALDEAKGLKVINDNLHAAFKTLQIGASLTPKSAAETTAGLLSGEAQPNNLTLQLVTALRKGIDKSRLAQQGLRTREDGGIENEHGDGVFPPAFVTAIEHILSLNDGPKSAAQI